jgi:hypothetical protein
VNPPALAKSVLRAEHGGIFDAVVLFAIVAGAARAEARSGSRSIRFTA